MIDLEDLEFKDVVISVPKDVVYFDVKSRVFDTDDSLVTFSQRYGPEEIHKGEELFWKTAKGEYPKWEFTDAGKELVKYIKALGYTE